MQLLRRTFSSRNPGSQATETGSSEKSPRPPEEPSSGRPTPASAYRPAESKSRWEQNFEAMASDAASDRETRLAAMARCAELAAELERIATELPTACRAAGLDAGDVGRLICAKLFMNFGEVDAATAAAANVPAEQYPWLSVSPNKGGTTTTARTGTGSSGSGSKHASSPSGSFSGGFRDREASGSDETRNPPNLDMVPKRSSMKKHSKELKRDKTVQLPVVARVTSEVPPLIPAGEGEDSQPDSGVVVPNKYALMKEKGRKRSFVSQRSGTKHLLYSAMVEHDGDLITMMELFKKGPIDLQASLDRDTGLPVPLIYAIAPLKSIPIVELLLEHKADVQTRWRGPGVWHDIREGMTAIEAAMHLHEQEADTEDGPTFEQIASLLHSKQTEDEEFTATTDMIPTLSKQDTTTPSSNAMFFCKHVEGHPDQVYSMEDQVGAGSFGFVCRARHRQSGQLHAVKCCPKDLIPTAELWSEIDVMQQLDHPHISRLHYTFEDEQNIYVASELCSGGQLFDAIIEAGYFTEKIGARLFKQAISAVTYIHFKNICHRDLKPENYLLSRKGPVTEAQVKLIDFGTAKRFDLAPMTTKVCTVHYVAPEVLKRSMDPYTEKVDVWSIGVMLFVMISGTPPFNNDDDIALMRQVKKAKWDFKPVSVWQNVSPEAKDLITSMLCVKVDKRLSAYEALHHAWCLKSHQDNVTFDQSTVNQMRSFVATSRLKKVALRIIARQVPDETIQKMRDLFLAVDEDNSGTLTMEEMDEAFVALNIPEGTRMEMRQILHQIDTDGNGSINYTEFIAATMKKQDYMKEEVCRAAFHVFDVNGDGVICKKDLAKLLNEYRERGENRDSPRLGEISEVAEILDEADSNGDGQLEFEEFMLLMADRTMEKITGQASSAAGQRSNGAGAGGGSDRISVSTAKNKMVEKKMNDDISTLLQELQMDNSKKS